MFKDFNNEEEKKSDFICIYLIALDNAVLYRFPRKQALRTKGIRWRRRWFFYYSIISIILLLLDDHYYYIIISILCWCFCVVYNILQKKCTYTLWSLEYLRLSVIGIDGCTLGMYHTHSLPSTDRHRWGYCWDVPQSTLYLHVQQTY